MKKVDCSELNKKLGLETFKKVYADFVVDVLNIDCIDYKGGSNTYTFECEYLHKDGTKQTGYMTIKNHDEKRDICKVVKTLGLENKEKYSIKELNKICKSSNHELIDVMSYLRFGGAI